MEKEIRLSYEEYKDLINEHENLKKQVKDKTHQLHITISSAFYPHSERIWIGIDVLEDEIRGRLKEYAHKIEEGQELKNKYGELLEEIKLKWWFKLFGGKYKT